MPSGEPPAEPLSDPLDPRRPKSEHTTCRRHVLHVTSDGRRSLMDLVWLPDPSGGRPALVRLSTTTDLGVPPHAHEADARPRGAGVGRPGDLFADTDAPTAPWPRVPTHDRG
ncbi:hypothetical protein ACQPYE_17305 [Actinosynnema sp. CA-299493]